MILGEPIFTIVIVVRQKLRVYRRTTMSKRIRIYTAEDVAGHKMASNCWITRGRKVYNVSAFLPDHPGGDDLILKHAGQDIEDVMKSPEEHEHSDAAYDMLEEYLIGRLGNDDSVVREGIKLNLDYHITINARDQTGKLRMSSIQMIRILRRTLRRTSSLIFASLCCGKCGRRTSGP